MLTHKNLFSKYIQSLTHLNFLYLPITQILRLNTPSHHLLLKIIYSKNSQIEIFFMDDKKLQTHFTLSNNKKMCILCLITHRYLADIVVFFSSLPTKFLLFIQFSWTAIYFFASFYAIIIINPKINDSYFSVKSHTQLQSSSLCVVA